MIPKILRWLERSFTFTVIVDKPRPLTPDEAAYLDEVSRRAW